MPDFSNKNILIIGASSGIGAQLSELLIEAGAQVYTASRTEPKRIGAKHLRLDITNIQGGELDELPDELHGLVYCPGSITLKPFNRLSEEDFYKDFEINALGAAKVIQANLKGLKKAKGASIVLFSTVASQVGMSFHASIAMAKGALEGLAKSLAAELASNNIRVNTIAPSLTDTPLADKLLATDDKREASAKRHPLGRVGTPQDMASLAQFLLSDDASWITGQSIGVDGGLAGTRAL